MKSYEIKITKEVGTKGGTSTRTYKAIEAKTPAAAIEALPEKVRAEIQQTEFFRKSTDTDDRPIAIFEGMFKTAPVKRQITVIEVDPAKPATRGSKEILPISTPESKPKAKGNGKARAAKSTAAPKAKASTADRPRCEFPIKVKGFWRICVLRPSNPDDRCRYHTGKAVPADAKPSGTPVAAPATKSTPKAAAKPAAKKSTAKKSTAKKSAPKSAKKSTAKKSAKATANA